MIYSGSGSTYDTAFSYLGDTTGELGNLDLLLGEVALEAGEDHLPLTGLQAVNQAATRDPFLFLTESRHDVSSSYMYYYVPCYRRNTFYC